MRCVTWIEAANDADQDGVLTSIERLKAAIDSAPKSRRWRLRARLGDRVRWYELPEDPTRE